MNKDIQDAYDYDDPIDRPMIDEQRDEQECKHEDTRYANDEQDITGNYCFNIVAHDCTVIICSDCKLTIKECLEVRDEQECKHEDTRHLYADHIESRKAVAHDCDMIICCDCGATTADCLDSTELCDECQLTREDCGEEGECEGMHDRITKCSCIRCEKEVRDE